MTTFLTNLTTTAAAAVTTTAAPTVSERFSFTCLPPFLSHVLQALEAEQVRFVVLCGVLGLVMLYWVLVSSRMAGLVLSGLANRLLLPQGERLNIKAINFSFTQGTLGVHRCLLPHLFLSFLLLFSPALSSQAASLSVLSPTRRATRPRRL